MNRSEIAVTKFKEGYNCAQSVIFSFIDKIGLSKDVALKLSNGFGAGMGRKQEVCGAISGAILVINLLFGRGENDSKVNQEIAYAKIRDLIDNFETRYSTISCKKLLNDCNLMTSEGQELFKSNKMIEKCYEFVEYSVKTLEKII